jgi:hypothetical protein
MGIFPSNKTIKEWRFFVLARLSRDDAEALS